MRALVVLGSLVVLVGCGNSIMIRDTGGGGTDTPGGGTDTPMGGTDVPRRDTPMMTGCPDAVFPAPTAGAVCAASTLTCLMTATTGMAQQACIMADPMAMACAQCINAQVFNSCTTMGTCADENGETQCCLEDTCPTGDAACVMMATAAGGACASQVMDFISCVNADNAAMPPRCGLTTFCFAMGMGFLPDYGAREATIPWSIALETLPSQIWSGSFAD